MLYPNSRLYPSAKLFPSLVVISERAFALVNESSFLAEIIDPVFATGEITESLVTAAVATPLFSGEVFRSPNDVVFVLLPNKLLGEIYSVTYPVGEVDE